MQTQPNVDVNRNVSEKEVTVPEYRFYQHICDCEHGQAIHDYKVIHSDTSALISEREHLNCRYLGCDCSKYREHMYSPGS